MRIESWGETHEEKLGEEMEKIGRGFFRSVKHVTVLGFSLFSQLSIKSSQDLKIRI